MNTISRFLCRPILSDARTARMAQLFVGVCLFGIFIVVVRRLPKLALDEKDLLVATLLLISVMILGCLGVILVGMAQELSEVKARLARTEPMPNQASHATSEPAPGAVSSAHEG